MTDYGVVTRNEEEVSWSAFDLGFYEVKDVTGRAAEPLSNAVNMVSCFGDNAAVEADPDLAPVDGEGRRATRERPYFDWAYVDPTHEEYRRGVLETVSDCAAANDDVRLDDVGFPRAEYCQCERCDRLFDEWLDAEGPSDGGPRDDGQRGDGPRDDEPLGEDHDPRAEWRASVITEFVAEATDRVPGRTYLTLYPDPYPGHLYERAGLDLDALADLVDEFVVPLYDTHYGTTYWLETIAKGFETRLADLDATFSIELYAVQVDVDELIHAAEVAAEYGRDVYFGYDASNASAALRRMRADRREGESHGTPGATPDEESDADSEEREE